MTFRVAAAQIAHETSAFSAVKTDLAAFAASGIHLGQDVVETSRGTNTEFGGFITGAAAQGFDLIPLLAVWATPSRLVTAEAIEHLTRLLGDGLRRAMEEGPLDGILLALHGAMVTEIDDDGDGYVLQNVREIVGPDVPVVATLDLHANISPRMTTERMPMRALMERAHVMEEDPRVVNVTIAGGFPLGDNPDAGFSIVVTTDDDPDLAAGLANELASEAWSLRDGFLGGVSSFEHAAELIRSLDSEEDVDMPVSGPLVLVDIADNPWSGGPGDSVELLRFLFAQQVEGAAVALVRDPEVVQEAIAAGPGGEIWG